MIFRAAYSDELGRARQLLNDHPVPTNAHFLLGVHETPVERIVAAIPSWPAPCPEGENPDTLLFTLGLAPSQQDLSFFAEILPHLTSTAQKQSLTRLRLDLPLPEEHPSYSKLTRHGFTIAQTERCFMAPGKQIKERTLRLYQRFTPKLPTSWTLTSLRGQDPETLFNFVMSPDLISPQAFQKYWKMDRGEHFEETYSKILLDGDQIIGALLVSQRGKSELYIHIEAFAPNYQSQSGLIAATLRNAALSQCKDEFPKTVTWHADSQKQPLAANVAFRHSGSEQPPCHFFEKTI